MNRLLISICILLMMNNYAEGQESGIVTEITSDTIYLGNSCELRYSVKNLEVQFEGPEFSDIRIISGPNISTSMQFINGKMTSAHAYSYTLYPEEIGSYFIEPAYFTASDTVYETPPISILVLPNPEGIQTRTKRFKKVDEQMSRKEMPKKEETIFRKKKKKI
jgi:hypothetical protein